VSKPNVELLPVHLRRVRFLAHRQARDVTDVVLDCYAEDLVVKAVPGQGLTLGFESSELEFGCEAFLLQFS
jgi:hypothetical protein